MKTIIKKFCFGLLIGISNVIPGFSGGTMALILGIYKDFTNALANIFTTPKKSLSYLWSILLGVLCGIGVATFTIVLCLERFPLVTASFFVGLVFATIPMMVKKINNRRSTSSILALIIAIIISISLPFLKYLGLNIDIKSSNIFIMLLVMLLASLASATMIIPAASGSMVLLSFGLYNSLIFLLKDTLDALLHLNFSSFWSNIIHLIPFLIGVVIGLVVISKVIIYLFNHHELIVWNVILGLLITSLFTIYYNTIEKYIIPYNLINKSNLVINIILSIIFLIIGFVSLTKLTKYQEDVEEEHEEKKVA